MYPKDENEGDLPFDTKEKMEIYHKPSIICLRLARRGQGQKMGNWDSPKINETQGLLTLGHFHNFTQLPIRLCGALAQRPFPTSPPQHFSISLCPLAQRLCTATLPRLSLPLGSEAVRHNTSPSLFAPWLRGGAVVMFCSCK